MSDSPFEVMEEFDLGDLSDVKEIRDVLPAASSVLFTVKNARNKQRKPETAEQYGQVKSISLEIRIAEGIELPKLDADGVPMGMEMKFKNKPMFLDLEYWADTTHANLNKPKYVGKERAYLRPLQQFLIALGYDMKDAPKLNDSFLQELIGKQFRADIKQKEINVKDQSGSWVKTGAYKNEIRNFKPA